MANVIPFEEKKALLKRQRARFVFMGGLTLLMGALVASVALAPALIAARINQASLQVSVEQVRAEVASDQAVHVRTQGLVDALTPILTATTSPVTLLTAALSIKPPGLSITSATFSGGSTGSIVLSGVSQNRQAVNAYRDALEQEGHFTSVTIPVAALVGTQEGRFTVTLSGFK
mgnify:FL=1